MSLLQSKASVIVENAVILIHLIAIYSPKTAPQVRDIALGSGMLLQHFYNSIYSHLEGQRILGRSLCTLWFSGPSDCVEKQLLKRMIPAGFLPYLAMPILSAIGKVVISFFTAKLYTDLILWISISSNQRRNNLTTSKKQILRQ